LENRPVTKSLSSFARIGLFYQSMPTLPFIKNRGARTDGVIETATGLVSAQCRVLIPARGDERRRVAARSIRNRLPFSAVSDGHSIIRRGQSAIGQRHELFLVQGQAEVSGDELRAGDYLSFGGAKRLKAQREGATVLVYSHAEPVERHPNG
jgi:hypothetical protein